MADTWRILLSGIKFDMDTAADPDMLEEAYVLGLPKWAVIEPQDVKHLGAQFADAIDAADDGWLVTESLAFVTETYGFCILDATIMLEISRGDKIIEVVALAQGGRE
jgi:hypothetical protein